MSTSCVFAEKDSSYQTTEEILALAHAEKQTNCASKLFLEELIKHSNEVKVDDPEHKVRSWVRVTMTGDPEPENPSE